jgi:hypothetical protein
VFAKVGWAAWIGWLIPVVTAIPASAQVPLVRLVNLSRPTGHDFQIGDRYEILITASPNQPVSVRTTMQGRTDWGPVIGSTDDTGRWSTTGQFEKRDFGGWREVWTVGGRIANPVVQFSVEAPCLPGRQAFASSTGLNTLLTCETAEGTQNFVTPSSGDPFRTPDGRLVPGRPGSMTPDQYHTEILEYLTAGPAPNPEAAHINLQSSHGKLGDEVGQLIQQLIGANALSESEIRNVLSIIRATFQHPEMIPQSSRNPSRTLLLLQHLADATDEFALKQQIAETVAYLEKL